jgi:hypothetical protein
MSRSTVQLSIEAINARMTADQPTFDGSRDTSELMTLWHKEDECGMLWLF